MEQQARNVTMKDWGFLAQSRYLLHDRDGKFCPVYLGHRVSDRTIRQPLWSTHVIDFGARTLR